MAVYYHMRIDSNLHAPGKHAGNVVMFHLAMPLRATFPASTVLLHLESNATTHLSDVQPSLPHQPVFQRYPWTEFSGVVVFTRQLPVVDGHHIIRSCAGCTVCSGDQWG